MINILIVIIVITSVLAFRVRKIFVLLDLSPFRIIQNNEYYRIFSHAFLHADYIHLGVNMVVLWSFGQSVESIFSSLETYGYISSAYPNLIFLILLGIAGSTVSTIIKHRKDPTYSAVGASGLVSAIVFTHIFFQPMEKIYFYFAIPIPGLVFGILYLLYSSYMGRKNKDNINHDAHIWGAIIGFLFPLIMNPKLINHFIENLGF